MLAVGPPKSGVIEWTSRWSVYLYIYTKVGKLSQLLSMCSDGNRESYDKSGQ